MPIKPLHVKLGLARQFLCALQKLPNGIKTINQHVKQILYFLSDLKLLNGVVNGPELRLLFKSTTLADSFSIDQKDAWLAFKDVCTNFLIIRTSYNGTYIQKMMKAFKKMGCVLSPKMHYF
ncbi:hypothetical protein A3Q56_03227 [Intoshia linei]|uniref:Uncharacterized protein n=1 Tax=Intoshia linei TaxID=1819745 RepID=A0A177B427_9BILA|nr:hypothetical protein A3Q56_03227 [Intoshia linei]